MSERTPVYELANLKIHHNFGTYCPICAKAVDLPHSHILDWWRTTGLPHAEALRAADRGTR